MRLKNINKMSNKQSNQSVIQSLGKVIHKLMNKWTSMGNLIISRGLHLPKAARIFHWSLEVNLVIVINVFAEL